MKKYKEKVDHFLKMENIEESYLKTKDGKDREYKEITLDFYLNTTYRSLFRLRENKMSGPQKMRLRQILREYDHHGYLTLAWISKESFLEWLEAQDISQIREVRDDCLESDHYMIKKFWRTLQRWDEQLENYCKYSTEDFKFTNAVTEAINNQCKVAKKVSHWFRHKKNYRRKLWSRFYWQSLS